MNKKIKIGREVHLEEKVTISQMIEEILEVKMIILIQKFSQALMEIHNLGGAKDIDPLECLQRVYQIQMNNNTRLKKNHIKMKIRSENYTDQAQFKLKELYKKIKESKFKK